MNDQKTDRNVHQESEAFKQEVQKLRALYDTVVETGTNDGTGSTKIFAEAKYRVITCEVNHDHYEAACLLYKDNPSVRCSHAFSLQKRILDPVTLKRLSPPPQIQNWLRDRIEVYKGSALYFLDSHWTVGFQEFKLLLELHMQTDCFLTILLDDVTNLKHKPSLHYLRTMYTKRYKITHLPNERWAKVNLLSSRS